MVKKDLHLFISTPGDVGQERLIVEKVIERLQGEFTDYFNFKTTVWEHEPVKINEEDKKVLLPEKTDIVISILWSRLGYRIPDNLEKSWNKIYSSGTEWEFESIAKSYSVNKTPDLLVYKKMSDMQVPLNDEDKIYKLIEQKKALDAFIEKWFGSAKNSFKAAFHSFETLEEFEKIIEIHLRKLIEIKITDSSYIKKHKEITWVKGSPYRGLETFNYEHAAVFFGRTKVIGEIKDAFMRQVANNCPFILIFGASGSGKSSLIKAGIVPSITNIGVVEGIGFWMRGIFRPKECGEDMLLGMSRAFFSDSAIPELKENISEQDLTELMKVSPQVAINFIKNAIKRRGEKIKYEEKLINIPNGKLIICIDQMEEMFTDEKISKEDRIKFISLLKALVRSGVVWVICSMRSDFFYRIEELPELLELKKGYGEYELSYPGVSELSQIIRLPASAAGVKFEKDPVTGEALDDKICNIAALNHEALPLLQYLLSELYNRKNSDNYITFSAYEELGGLEGVIAKRAEEVIKSLDINIQNAFSDVFKKLMTLEHKKSGTIISRRRILYSSFRESLEQKLLVDELINKRLLISNKDNSGKPYVEVVHEALFKYWPRLVGLIEENKEFLLLRDRIGSSAEIWINENMSKEYLLQYGKELGEGEYLLQRWGKDLDEYIYSFITASIKYRSSKKRIKKALISAGISAFIVSVSSFAIYSYLQWQNARLQQKLAGMALNKMLYEVPDKLKNIPGTFPKMINIYGNSFYSEDKEISSLSKEVFQQLLKSYTSKASSDEELKEIAEGTYNIGNISSNNEQYKDSITAYNLSLNYLYKIKTQENLETLRRIMDVLLCIGESYAKLNDKPDMEASFNKAIALEKSIEEKDAANSNWDKGNIYFRLGNSYNTLRDFKNGQLAQYKALDYLEKINSGQGRELAKDKIIIIYNHGVYYEILNNNYNKALEFAYKSVNLDPKLDGGKLVLAHALLFNNQYDKAKKLYLELKDKPYTNSSKYSDQILTDIQGFKDYGLNLKELDEIKKLME